MPIITLAAAVILIMSGIAIASRKSLPLRLSPGTIGFAALAASSLISLLAVSQNMGEALVGPLGPITFIALAILVAAGVPARPKIKARLSWVLYTVAALVGLIAIYQGLGVGKLMFPGASSLADPLWNLTGNATTTLALLVIGLSLLFTDIRSSLKENSVPLLLFAFLVTAGAAMTAWHLTPRVSTMLPISTGGSVVLETFKSMRGVLVGVGSENFVTAYTAGRPQWMSATALWNTRFTTNANFFLHVATVYGLLGLGAGLAFAYAILQGITKKDTFLAPKLLSLAALLLVPPTVTLLTVIAAVFILSGTEQEEHAPAQWRSWRRILGAFVCFTLGIILFLGVGFVYWGQFMYMQALSAAKRDEGTKAYNLLVGALKVNPYATKYHMTYSQISIALASSLAGELETLTATESAKAQEDQKLIERLIDQGIREAKIAVNLNTNNVIAWENLSSVYQSLIPVATGADAWAAASYEKTIELDPNNPLLLLNLGAVYIHQKKYDEAVRVFERAARIRPGYANALYNLANAYRLKGDTVKAAETLEKTILLVPPESSDYYKAKNELDALKNLPASDTPATAAPAPSELTIPQ